MPSPQAWCFPCILEMSISSVLAFPAQLSHRPQQVPVSPPGMPAGAWVHARVSGKPVFGRLPQQAPHRHGFGTPEACLGGRNLLSSSVFPVPARGPRKSGLARPRGCLPACPRSSPAGKGPAQPASPAWPAGGTMSHWAVSPARCPLLPALEYLQRGCERTAGAESLLAAPWGLPPPGSSGLAFLTGGHLQKNNDRGGVSDNRRRQAQILTLRNTRGFKPGILAHTFQHMPLRQGN